MKYAFHRSIRVFLLVSSMSLIGHTVQSQGLAEDGAKPQVATAEPSVTFSKLTYTRGRVTKGAVVMINDYFLPKQTPNNWTHKVSMYLYPKHNDPQLYVKNMTANLAKGGINAEPIALENDKLAGLTFFEKTEHMIKFNVFIYHTTKSGKLLIGRHFTLRAKPEKEKPFRTLVAIQKKSWGKELISTQFPGFKFPPSEPKPDAPQAGLPELKFMKETVTDSRAKGHLVKIDEAFALKNGSEKKIKAPFSIALPQTNNVILVGNPKVPETVQITLLDKDKKYLEGIRFTDLSMDTSDPMSVRLQKTNIIIRQQLVPNFFKDYKDAKVVGNYTTKVGPYDASVTIGQRTEEDGDKSYVKFVGLLQEGKVNGLAVVLMVNGSAFEQDEVRKRLSDGFAQQVLHSIRFVQ